VGGSGINTLSLLPKSGFNGKNRIKMGYIARNLTTNEVFYSKGATKLAEKIGCSESTILKFFNKKENKGKDKPFKGWTISKTIDLLNRKRGFSF
jgi:hypothetical protein